MSSCKPYQCDVCLKLFKKKSNMSTHKLTHSEETQTCYCGAEFKCLKYLRNHQYRVHSNHSFENEPSSKKVKIETEYDEAFEKFFLENSNCDN